MVFMIFPELPRYELLDGLGAEYQTELRQNDEWRMANDEGWSVETALPSELVLLMLRG